jgi:hypothetical protein
MASRWTGEEIEAIVRRYEQRGRMTRRAFCVNEGIPPATLGYYLRRRPARNTLKLAELRIEDAGSTAGRFALVLSSGRRIECGRADLGDLISAAERS